MSDVLTRCEDAVEYALPYIYGSALGTTMYKGQAGGELATPAIIISGETETPISENTRSACGLSCIVAVEVSVVTNANDSDRAAHGTIAGLVESIVRRSIDQMPAACTAAAVSGLTIQDANYGGCRRDYDEQHRKTIFTVNLTIHAT